MTWVGFFPFLVAAEFYAERLVNENILANKGEPCPHMHL